MTDEPRDSGLEAEIDGLYQLTPDEFVEARNALAARRKAAGDAAGATRIKGLKRPSIPAWAVNRLHATARGELDAFLGAARRLQSAQAQGASGDDLREAIKSRRDAQTRVLKSAESLLGSGGRAVNPAALQRVSGTLEALAVGAPGSTEAAAGRLTVELEPPGFEALAGVALLPGPSPRDVPATSSAASPAPVVAESPAQEDQQATALADAERRLDRVRQQAREAAGAHQVAEKRAEGAQAELQEATRRFERAKERASLMAAEEALARQEKERLDAERDKAERARDALVRAGKASGGSGT